VSQPIVATSEPQPIPERDGDVSHPADPALHATPMPEAAVASNVAEMEPIVAPPAAPAADIVAAQEPAPSDDPVPEPLIKPIVIGGAEDAPVAEKKRGWWHR
jgi:hypothetical protein